MYSSEQMIQKELNKIWGDWTIDRTLGEGSYGKVFRIIREDFGHTYEAALKVITIPKSQSEINSVMSNGMDEKSVTSYFKSIVKDLVEEFALMAKLKGNTNIVSYEDHAVVPFEEGIGWNIYIRMELLTPLYSHMKQSPMTIRDVINLGIDMCQALEVCQRYNIIHRDIKPENVFVSDLGRYKLGDFGIARQLENANTGMSRKGTYTYMAPEVYKGVDYNSTVDIYSLGIMLYRFLNNNRAPFLPPYPQPLRYSDSEHAIVLRMSGAEITRPCNAKGRLAEIILKACAYDPKDRYESASDMKRALRSILYDENEAGVIYPQGDGIKSGEHESDKWYANSVENVDCEATEETVVLDSKSSIVVLDENDAQNYLKTVTKQNKEKNKKIFVPVIVVAVLVFVIVGVAIFKINENVTVPNVLNMTVEEALRSTEGLKISEEETEYSETVEKGKIISQSIKEGDSTKKGSTIKVVVSGGKLVEVPSFVGMKYKEASAAATNVKLRISMSEERFSKNVAKGLIIEQSVNSGEKLAEGQTVSVVVSKGIEQTVVPDVTGMKLSKAKKVLKENNLKYSLEEEYSDSVAKNKIIKQSVKAKKSVDVNTEIKLVVSKGEKKKTSTVAPNQNTTYSTPSYQEDYSKYNSSDDDDDTQVDVEWDLIN